MTRRSKQVARIAATGAALAVVTAAGVAERTALAASFTVLAHLHWIWIPAAVGLESVSMAAFAVMLRRLLAAGGARVGVRPMLATAYAANAVSVSVPLAGPALATAFTFRRFTRQGADAPLAGWSLLAGGVTSSAAAALVVVGGRHRPLARSSAGLQLGYRRAKPQHHVRRARGHRGIAQPGAGRHRAGCQPGPGGGIALPPRQFLAGRTGRLAGRVLAAPSPDPARSRSIAPHPPRTGRRHGH